MVQISTEVDLKSKARLWIGCARQTPKGLCTMGVLYTAQSPKGLTGGVTRRESWLKPRALPSRQHPGTLELAAPSGQMTVGQPLVREVVTAQMNLSKQPTAPRVPRGQGMR